MPGSQDFAADPRNANVLIYLNGALVPRPEARVSVFDAGFVLGDGVWEGLRLHKGRLVFLDAHIDRLLEGAAQIRLELGLSRDGLVDAIRQTVQANGMHDGVHIRLMATRGVKAAVNQDPRNALGQATIVIVAEHKVPAPEIMTRGLALWTSAIRCTPAEMFDMRLNSHSRLNLIRALIDVLDKGADEALMLDPHGFVSSCNATNFFFVRDGVLCTSRGDYCFNGVTRANVMDLARAHGISLHVGDFNLADVAQAEEAFVTGTFGGLTPVRSIDGRMLPAGLPGPMTAQLKALYEDAKDREPVHVS
jgi:branched-chain amino acid aminotransferase